MKKFLILLLGGVLCCGGCAPFYGPAYAPAYAPAPGVGYVVAVGDRPYYTRGPYYVYRGRRHVWVNGHWAHRHGRRVWVHGYYGFRG